MGTSNTFLLLDIFILDFFHTSGTKGISFCMKHLCMFALFNVFCSYD